MRAARFVLAFGLTAFLFTSPAAAAPITITFDAGDPIGGLAANTTLSNQYAGVGVTFSPNGFTGAGGPTGSWASNTSMTVVSSTGVDAGGLGTPSLVSGNLLHSFNGWLNENGDASFRATFAGGITSLSATFAGIATPGSSRLFAYNGSTLLASATATTTGQQTLTVSSAGPITSVVFTPGDFFDWVGVDNITFTPVDVPEPATLTLLALGVAAAARSRRNRRDV